MDFLNINFFFFAMSVFRLPRMIKTNKVDSRGKIDNGLKTQGPNWMC